MKMCAIYLTSVCLAVIAFISVTQASHFRGGTISWEHLQSNGTLHQVRFNFRLGWRRQNQCDADTVNNGSLLYQSGSWILDYRAKSSAFPQSTAIICSSYDIGEDWGYGFNSFVADIDASSPFSIVFDSCCWISGLAFGGSDWSIGLVDVDLDARSDTGKTNRPPSTLSPPVIRLQLGCPSSIRINALDADNDLITCRYAVALTECGDVCGTYQHFTLNKTTCTIDYDGGGGAYTVPVALMLEDHPRQSIVLGGNRTVSTPNVLSSIPLQILVKIHQAGHACNQVPTYPSFGIQPNSVIPVAESGALNEKLYAYPSAVTFTISQFVIVGPIGLESSPIYSVGNGIYATNITWQPGENQGGMHIVCYYAVDTANVHGEQRCFTVDVEDVPSPCDLDNGGCSDICIPQETSFFCACSKPCWELAFDRKTCGPAMNVTCSGAGLDIYVPQCASSHPFVVGTDFGDFSGKSCQSNIRGSSHYLNFSSLDCGSTIKSNPVFVEYGVNLWAWKGIIYEGSADAITRGTWKKIPITCSLSATGNVTGSFVPVLPYDNDFVPPEVTFDSFGSFVLSFEYYKSDAFRSAFGPQDFPIEVTVNDDMYFALGAVGRGGLSFFTQSCVAMSNETLGTSELFYYFISDGCLLDPTLVRYNTSNGMENRFSIKAFEFESRLLATRKTSDIYINCEVILCDASDSSSRCFQGCLPLNGRRKRSLRTSEVVRTLKTRTRRARDVEEIEDDDENPPLQETVSPSRSVASRFILVVDTQPTKAPEGSGGRQPGYTILMLSVSSLCLHSLLVTL